MEKHIRLGDTVIVVDGSYIVNKDKTKPIPYGINFIHNGQHELLRVTRVNIPFRTDYSCLPEVLARHNNCEIESASGDKYYCSLINIIRFE